MVTTFNPPARAKRPVKKSKPKPPTAMIALGVGCGVLLILVFMLISKSGAANDRANMLSESVVEIAATVGAEGVTAESLTDAEAAPEALEALRVAATEQAAEIETKTAELEQAQAESARIQGELASAQEAASDAQSQANTASSDLRKRDAELSALQIKYDEDVARLTEELDALKGDVAATAAATVEDEEDGMVEEEPAEVAEESKSSDILSGNPEISKHFTSYKYDTGKSNLTIRAGNNGSIKFLEVPRETFDSMTNAPSFDIFYRFKLMDEFESKPEARAFIINLND